MKLLTRWQSLSICLTAILICAVSTPGTLVAQQNDNSWTELGENFDGTSPGSNEAPLDGTTFVLPTSGAEVVLVEGLEPEDTDVEDQIIVNTPQGMGAIGVLPALGSPQSVLETYATAFGESLDGAGQLHLESDEKFASGLYSVDLLGISMLMYITVDALAFPGYMTIQVAIAEADIAGAIVTMRESVAINGVPMFSGVDEQEVQDIADDYPDA